MIRAEVHFINGIVKINLLGDNVEDKQILELATNGRNVTTIIGTDKGVALTLAKSDAAKVSE